MPIVADTSNKKHKSQVNSDENLAKLITSKIDDGNIRAALRILLSDDKPAEDNDETYTKLLERHPLAPANRIIKDVTVPNDLCLQLTENDVLSAARSFPIGSSGGPDGIRPQHIIDLLGSADIKPTLLTAITALVNHLLQGHCPSEVVPFLFGGSLTALTKKTGGIRPIAVGYYWRRLAAKCANTYASAKLLDYFNPIQLGVGVRGGCEAAVHACRRYVTSMQEGHVVAKLDFTNAFNCIHRDAMLNAVFDKVPEIYSFCNLAYRGTSILKFGKRLISSQEGVQQGDPLGPLIFCLTIHPTLLSLESEFLVGYMDDITIGGPVASVASDINVIIVDGSNKGMHLNVAKCELISKDVPPTIVPLDQFIQVKPDAATLLGAPLLAGKALDKALEKKYDEFKRASKRLRLITSHDALVLLKSSCSSPRLMHILRSSPCDGHMTLTSISDLLRECLNLIANVNINDLQWLQASLPVKVGGLGLRSPMKLALSTFLASVSGTLQLQNDLLRNCQALPDDQFNSYLLRWTTALQPLPPPVGTAACRQRFWDAPFVESSFATLLASQPDEHNQARLLAAAAPHSGDWLHVLPISSCGLRLDDDAIRVAIGLRLGANLCDPHVCPCGTFVNSHGTHGLSCKRGSSKLTRHATINNLIHRALVRARIPSTMEPTGLSRSDGKRPDGLTLVPWSAGKSIIWDVTVVDTLAASYITTTSKTAGGAAEIAVNRKEEKYAALSINYNLIVIALETLGPLGTKSYTFLRELGRRLTIVTEGPRETSFLFQRISIAVQRFNAIRIRDSFPVQVDID